MKKSQLEIDIGEVLNRHSAENASNTPDFILAEYLLGCLNAFNAAVRDRTNWYAPEAERTDKVNG